MNSLGAAFRNSREIAATKWRQPFWWEWHTPLHSMTAADFRDVTSVDILAADAPFEKSGADVPRWRIPLHATVPDMFKSHARTKDKQADAHKQNANA